MEILNFKSNLTKLPYQKLINSEDFAKKLFDSGIYEAGDKGVNYIYNGKVYNFAISHKKTANKKVVALFIRAMSEQEFYLGVFYKKLKPLLYNGASGHYETSFSLEQALMIKTNGPSPQFKGALNKDLVEHFSKECPPLIPKQC